MQAIVATTRVAAECARIAHLTGTLEVVLWNEVFVKVSDFLAPGRVIAIQGKLDNRDDAMRATADKAKLLKADAANGAHSCAGPDTYCSAPR